VFRKSQLSRKGSRSETQINRSIIRDQNVLLDSSLSKTFQPPSTKPGWVIEMDEVILILDRVMSEISTTDENEESVATVRSLLNRLWPCVESMAAACSDGDERWVLQRNRLFAALFRVLERRESDLRLNAARCVLSLLSAGRASMSVSLQVHYSFDAHDALVSVFSLFCF
jgi:hypothetical protein